MGTRTAMAKGAAVRGGRAGAARTRVRGSRRTNAAGLRHSHPSHSHPSPLARCARAAVCRGQQLQKSLSRRRSYEDATGSGLSTPPRCARGARVQGPQSSRHPPSTGGAGAARRAEARGRCAPGAHASSDTSHRLLEFQLESRSRTRTESTLFRDQSRGRGIGQ